MPNDVCSIQALPETWLDLKTLFTGQNESLRRPMKLTQYSHRSIRFQELWSIEGLALKGYAIGHQGERIPPRLWLAAREAVTKSLLENPTRHGTHGAGFVTVHAGIGESQVNLDLWINENELLHRVWVTPSVGPVHLVAPPVDHNSVCVWEIYVQAFERHAWIAYVLNNPDGPDLGSYLTARLDADV